MRGEVVAVCVYGTGVGCHRVAPGKAQLRGSADNLNGEFCGGGIKVEVFTSRDEVSQSDRPAETR